MKIKLILILLLFCATLPIASCGKLPISKKKVKIFDRYLTLSEANKYSGAAWLDGAKEYRILGVQIFTDQKLIMKSGQFTFPPEALASKNKYKVSFSLVASAGKNHIIPGDIYNEFTKYETDQKDNKHKENIFLGQITGKIVVFTRVNANIINCKRVSFKLERKDHIILRAFFRMDGVSKIKGLLDVLAKQQNGSNNTKNK